ncbi:MAG: hypothetical protein VXW65_13310 [Pseudomonadota bacterium]|nr:hypothetical protein [Pseudomonadota bacterium]
MNRTRTLILPVLVALLLSACSRAPSEQDIETAYRLEVDPVNNMSRQIAGEALTIQVNSVKKNNCEKTADQQYRCQVEIDTTMPFVGQRQQTTELVLQHTEQGWKIVRDSR